MYRPDYSPFSIIITPDCDLLQDFKDRENGKISKLFSVLLFKMEDAQNVKGRIGFGSKEMKQVQKNMLEQFHSLNAIDASYDLFGVGMPPDHRLQKILHIACRGNLQAGSTSRE